MGDPLLSSDMEETKTSRARVAFVLLCGLAVCCSVMYVTADGEESVLAEKASVGYLTPGPESVESVDVKKAGLLVTNTPDGRKRLLIFLDKVEAQIAKEVAGRKADIAAVRAQMAKNFAYNQAARAKMKKNLLHKMAINAKKAHDDLTAAMRVVQATFAKQAALDSKRNAATIKRSAKTREIMRKNKHEAAHNLKMAVLSQQRALSALASATNARIAKTNKHIAANAAQIKENAKKARKDLESAMGRFDKKMANVSEEAKMAKDRHHADQMLKHASARMDAALNAHKALQDKRFAQTVSDIAAAKKEAKTRVNQAVTSFKVGILKLSAVVHQQSKKLNNRVTQLSGVISNNKLEQAKVNRQVGAEIKRMIAVGDARYKEHLKKDKELRRLMAKNKAETKARMTKMSNSFFAQIASIRKQMKADRARAEARLAKKTAALYDTLAKNKATQAAVNAKLTAATRRARLDAASSLHAAKASFTTRVAGLHKKVTVLAAKHNDEIQQLAGVEAANALKSAQGRAQLKAISSANKAELKNAVRDAIHKGEQRALGIEKKMKGMNAKMKAALNQQVTTEIGTLTKHIHGQINELNLQTAAARAEMRKEILFAIKSAAALAKQNLKKQVAYTEARFPGLEKSHAAANAKNAAGRAALTASVKANKASAVAALKNAMAAQNRALLALRQETAKKVSKTNKNIAAHALRMEANAKAVSAQMKADTKALQAKLEAARKAAVVELSAVNAASAARYSKVIKSVEKSLDAARKSADEKFGAAFRTMAKNRKNLDRALGAGVKNLNDKLAAQSALADARFSKTVKNIADARAKASADVGAARKAMTSAFVGLTASIKEQETRLMGDIQVVSAMIVSDKASQVRINKRVSAEIKKIVKLENGRHSESVRARGKLKAIMNENKRAAAEETAALAKASAAALAKTRSQAAAYKRSFAKDLTKATKKLYGAIATADTKQTAANAALTAKLGAAKASAAAGIAGAKKMFSSRPNTLTNAVVSNAAKFEKNLGRMTGVAMSWKKSAAGDRKNIRTLRSAMKADLDKSTARAIQLGEAKAKAVQQRALSDINKASNALLTTASAKIESMADNVFKLVQGNRQKIADNYLSLKAYAACSADLLSDYLAKGKGSNLASVGDLLQTVSAVSKVQPDKDVKALGKGAVSKINGLVNEYITTMAQVRDRWPMGLGKYLLAKLETAMQGTGALEVDKVSDKAGNFVFVNGHSVGLSSKLSDFESLAVRMTTYEATLAKITGTLSGKKGAGKAYVKPPEWQGN